MHFDHIVANSGNSGPGTGGIHFDHIVANPGDPGPGLGGMQSGLHNTLDTGYPEPVQHMEMHHLHH